MERVVLIGTMGSGKTTVGRALAARLGVRYWDNDEAFYAMSGRTAAEVAASDGVAALHAMEAAVLAEGLALREPAVVSAPGSVTGPLPGVVVWLRAPEASLRARALGRPAVGDVVELDRSRRSHYAALATFAVDVGDRPPGEVVDEILRSCEKLSQGSVTFPACDSGPSS